MIHPGLVSVTFRALSLAQIVDITAAAGLAGIEWGGDVHVAPGDWAQAELAAGLCRERGLRVASYGSYYRLGQEDPAEFALVLETCRRLGAFNIRVWAGDSASTEADAAYRQAVALDARRCAGMAAEAGISLSLEFHTGTLTDTAASALALLTDVGSDNLYTYWQAFDGKGRAENLADLDLLGSRLSNVHCHSHRAGVIGPLEETADWPDYFRAAARDGKERWALIEFVAGHQAAALLRDAAVLKNWLAALSA
jgi:sugar phosphate isomerase/epimerase